LVTFRGAGIGDMPLPGALGKMRLRLVGGRVCRSCRRIAEAGHTPTSAESRLAPAGLLETIMPALTPPPRELSLTRYSAGHFEPVGPGPQVPGRAPPAIDPDIPRSR
jgi:hypothetical protein